MKRMTSMTRTAVALGIALGLSATALAADLKIGFVSSLSGPVSALGIPYKKGIRAAIAESPTLAGHKVELIVLDDASDPTTAGRNARKLVVEDKVDVLIGTSGVPGAMAIAAVAKELNVPLISPTPVTIAGGADTWAVTVSQSFPLMVSAVAG